MKILSILLIILSLSKLAVALSSSKDDFAGLQDLSIPGLGSAYKSVMSYLVLDGLLGLICGMFIAFVL